MVVVADPGTIFVKQARPFSPSMFMAQEPQIPSRQDLRITIPLPVLPSKHECGVLFVLDLEQGIKDHSAAARTLFPTTDSYSLRSTAYFS